MDKKDLWHIQYSIFLFQINGISTVHKLLTEFLKQMSIVFLWNAVDSFWNMLWIPIKMACEQAASKQYFIVELI